MMSNQSDSEKQLVIFRLQQEEFGIDIMQVREIVPMMIISRLPNAPNHIEGVINLRGRVIPVMNLNERLGLSQFSESIQPKRIVVVEVDEATIGLLVDDVPEILRIAKDKIESSSEIIKKRKNAWYIQGVGKLDTRLIIILDLSEILSLADQNLVENASHGEAHE
ncbi:chemotaxis protein CheW [Legionella impletisoli]|uniref:Chemotaxis protein CheW n=1 Tax=Legionella impletisoli TaxID=343510 RepID=A0A917JQ44_9GAMM|nr:chemotaxis protein CheW [Legionella impletisoli]GGI78156.1 chemotaxis protein CheW [Legionella impletisoli]